MLNELYDLSRALGKSGVEREACASGLEVGRGQEGIRIFLAPDGSINRSPEAVSADQMKTLLKWSTGPGLSLPVYNLDSLYSVPQADFDRLRKAWTKCQRSAALFNEPHPEPSTLNWPPISGERSRTKDFQSTLKIACEQIRKGAGEAFDEGGDAWRVLLDTLEKQDALQLIERIAQKLCAWVRTASCPKCAFALLYCLDGKSSKTPVHFEADGVFDAPVYSPKAQQWLTQARIRFTQNPEPPNTQSGSKRGSGEDSSGAVAVWGSQVGCTKAYPQNVDSPIGQLSFFNRDVEKKPTSVRYDAQYAVFPVGSDKRNELITNFKWLINAERKGKTWCVRSKFGKPDKKTKTPPPFLLLTYLADSIENTPEHLTEIFTGPPEEESDRAVVQFETRCSDVVQALDGIPSLNAESRIQVFALHKPDPGRTQIFASESITQGALKMMAASWQTHCRDHPPILLLQFTPEGEATLLRDLEPLVPFPYQAIECLNTIWEKCEKADNAKCESASDYGFADAFELLRRTGEHPTDTAYLGRMLDLAVRRALPLMTAVAHAMHQDVAKQHQRKRVFLAQGDKGCGTKSLVQARRWPCLLCLLLTRLGYQSNTFMKEPAYLIGRFLAQLDRLHGYYAKHVSGKEDGLRQLLGNSLMATALESPLRAFELAGQRMLPYQAWGCSFAQGRKLKEALGTVTDDAKATNNDKWDVYRALEEMGRIAEELSDRCIPEANIARLAPCNGDEGGGGHESKAPAKLWLDFTDTLKGNDRAWMHADSAAKAQMLLGYLARTERGNSTANPKSENTPKPPDFE